MDFQLNISINYQESEDDFFETEWIINEHPQRYHTSNKITVFILATTAIALNLDTFICSAKLMLYGQLSKFSINNLL